jgi:chemotaxis protein histidine kinase CheA
MWNEFCDPAQTTEVRIVESCGMKVALPEANVIGILPAAGQPEHVVERADGLAVMYMDDRYRPVVSLRQALCVETPAGHLPREDSVVVLRLGAQLFGLLVEDAEQPEVAMVMPTVTPAPAVSVFTQMLQMADGGILFSLNPIWLALTLNVPLPAAQEVDPTARLAA